MFSDGKGIFDIIIVGEDDFEFLFEFMVNYIFSKIKEFLSLILVNFKVKILL